MDEFNPSIAQVTQVSPEDIQKADAALQNAFGTIL